MTRNETDMLNALEALRAAVVHVVAEQEDAESPSEPMVHLAIDILDATQDGELPKAVRDFFDAQDAGVAPEREEAW